MTRCLTCDEELWGPEEAHGYCVLCRLRNENEDERVGRYDWLNDGRGDPLVDDFDTFGIRR